MWMILFLFFKSFLTKIFGDFRESLVSIKMELVFRLE